MSKQQNAILWPEGYTPGFTENFASNEIIAAGLSAADVWPLLVTPSLWQATTPTRLTCAFMTAKARYWPTAIGFTSRPSASR